jgi:hypothetical protein
MDQQPMNERPVDEKVSGIMQKLGKEFVVVGKRSVRVWHVWLVIGIIAGTIAGVTLVANRSGEISGVDALAVQPYAIGDTVVLLKTSEVREGVSQKANAQNKPAGSRAKILSGPQKKAAFGVQFLWYQVEFGDGSSGWINARQRVWGSREPKDFVRKSVEQELVNQDGLRLGCNVVKNSAFENIDPQRNITGWKLLGSRTADFDFNLSEYPEKVRSGDYAAKVTVRKKGDVRFTHPEKIAVDPVTKYRVSANMLSEDGTEVTLVLVEFNLQNKGTVRSLARGGGTKDWEFLEAEITTQPDTKEVRVRLQHSHGPGTFYWDDIMLSRVVSDESRCFDARHYITQSTPGYKMCTCPLEGCNDNRSVNTCTDGLRDTGNSWVRNTVNYTNRGHEYAGGNQGVVVPSGRSADFIGVQFNRDRNVSYGRCFTTGGKPCGLNERTVSGNFTPQEMPVEIELPILPGTTGREAVVTPETFMYQDWESFTVWEYDSATKQVGRRRGTQFYRRFAYIAPEINFGGEVGVQKNVFVIEEEGTNFDPLGLDLGGGQRVERYFYVPGLAKVGQFLLEDRDNEIDADDCLSHNTGGCNGEYRKVGGLIRFIFSIDEDIDDLGTQSKTHVNWW